MATALFSSSARAALRSGAPRVGAAGLASTTFTRGKATLPDLPCKYCDLYRSNCFVLL